MTISLRTGSAPRVSPPIRSTKCRICTSEALAPVHDFGDLPVAGYLVETLAGALSQERFASRLVLCRGCGLLQQDGDAYQGILIDRVYSNYRPTYSMSEAVRNYMHGFLDEAASFAGTVSARDTVLEIGSNDGSMFDLLRARGFRPAGIDPSATAVPESDAIVVREFFGEEVARAFVKQHGRVKLAFCRHTLEHVFDPVDFMKGIELVLEDQGVCAIEVPYLPSQLSANQFAPMTFQHISFFTYESLARLCDEARLSLLAATLSRMDGGAIIIFVGRKSRANRETTPESEGVLHLERLCGVSSYALMLQQFQNIVTRMALLRQHVIELRQTRRAVVAYGAGAKGQSMLNMIGLTHDLIPYVVDDTPGSAGLFVPGTGTEVITSSDKRFAEADIVLVTAPTHVDEIVSKESRRHSRKGFIRTSPDVSYVSRF